MLWSIASELIQKKNGIKICSHHSSEDLESLAKLEVL